MLDTPVAIVIWRRPETTRRVLREIARVQPRRLMVIADGPTTPADEEVCLATRATVEEFDWEGEVLRNFVEEDIGLHRRVVSGFDWVFEHCEEAILLEDDCVPHPHFFRFCTELLERYRDQDRVLMIGGADIRSGRGEDRYSYRFSRYPGVWGWATWRRAWELYDGTASAWAALRQGNRLEELLGDRSAAAAWRRLLDEQYPSEVAPSDSWDHQWVVTCWAHDAVTIKPNVNLVSNIGFGPDAVHTQQDSRLMNLPTAEMSFPLQHPPDLTVDRRADHLHFHYTMGMNALPKPLIPVWRALPRGGRQWVRAAHRRLRARRA